MNLRKSPSFIRFGFVTKKQKIPGSHFSLPPVWLGLNIALKNKFKVISNHHEKKAADLQKQQEREIDKSLTTCIKNTGHNFSSYQLTEEHTALSYGLDHHIPCKFNSNRIHAEFEKFDQIILKDISHIPDNNLLFLKTKLQNTGEKYSDVPVRY